MKPILFKTELVEAIINGSKTQTRRIVKTKGEYFWDNVKCSIYDNVFRVGGGLQIFEEVKCPYGRKSDLLWVRESWCLTQPYHPEDYHFGYKAYNPLLPHSENKASSKYDFSTPDQWKPSIHMPKEACRLFLLNQDIRIERLQDITPEDAIAEGIAPDPIGDGLWTNYLHDPGKVEETGYRFLSDPVESFKSLWISINGAESWDENPWLWVVEFEQTVKPANWPLD